MCGIAGFWGKDSEWERDITAMCDRIAHRGPDDAGIWSDEYTQLVMGHRRLSILDLSEKGRQPMLSQNERWVISYNGEIYNYRDLLKDLRQTGSGSQQRFLSQTDTEVLLETIDRWGLKETLNEVRGMFAFALYDREEDVLYLVRDRIGEKPLYYGHTGDRFVFASDIASIEALPWFDGKVSREALKLYFQHGYIPAPYSIYENIYKLEAGTYLTVRDRGANITGKCYWSAQEVAVRGQRTPFTGSEEEAAAELKRLMQESIRMQMLADVPVGAFLSAGIDSSTVVSLMQEVSDRPVKTFTIGVENAQHNEAVTAKEIAGRLGTDHTEWYITPTEAQTVLPQLGRYYSEPFADSSQIPMMLVSKLARGQVTVSLSGDGGDELFAGYKFYEVINRVWGQIEAFPKPLRAPGGWAANHVPLLRRTKPAQSARVLSCKSPEALYNWYRTQSYDRRLLHSDPRAFSRNDLCQPWILSECEHNIMLMDLTMYHPDDILVKVDRAAMAYSLETRIPMLDVKVVEFAWSLPFAYKKNGDVTKKVLRDILYQYVPRELVERPKTGFTVPIDEWLRGDMKPWAEDMIYGSQWKKSGLLHEKAVWSMWESFIDGRISSENVWKTLVLGEWMRGRK